MLDRRSFMAATAAAVVAPNVTDAKECTKSYDWETMSLEARNLAFNNVEHIRTIRRLHFRLFLSRRQRIAQRALMSSAGGIIRRLALIGQI